MAGGLLKHSKWHILSTQQIWNGNMSSLNLPSIDFIAFILPKRQSLVVSIQLRALPVISVYLPVLLRGGWPSSSWEDVWPVVCIGLWSHVAHVGLLTWEHTRKGKAKYVGRKTPLELPSPSPEKEAVEVAELWAFWNSLKHLCTRYYEKMKGSGSVTLPDNCFTC